MRDIIQYLKKPHKIAGFFNVLFSAFCTLCIVLYSEFHFPVKAAAFTLFIILLFFILASMLSRRGINKYLDSVEQLFTDDKILINEDSINNFMELEKKGIIEIKVRADYSELLSHLIKAKNEINFICYYGNKFLQETEDELIKAIERNVKIKMIIADIESDLLKEVWVLEGIEKKEKWNEAFKKIKTIQEKTKERPYLFKYHICNSQIRYALILIDNKWAWWTPYHPGIDVKETTSFLLANKGDKSIINQCKEYFYKLWYYLDLKEREASNNKDELTKLKNIENKNHEGEQT